MQRLAQALARSHLIFANREMWPRMKSLNALLFLASSSVPTPTPAQQEILERFRIDAHLNKPDPALFYGVGPKGYTDYLALADAVAA
jgi:hypothetical protein